MDLTYAYRQLPLSQDTTLHCNFFFVGRKSTGTYRFETGFLRSNHNAGGFLKSNETDPMGISTGSCVYRRYIISNLRLRNRAFINRGENPKEVRQNKDVIEANELFFCPKVCE